MTVRVIERKTGKKMGPTIGSLFSGVGGLDMAVEAVFGGTMVWQSEVHPAAAKVLAHRYPHAPNLGDITAIDWATVTPVDVLCGGFPCQDVSAAGRRAGIREGTRSGLWRHFAEAVDILRPHYVVIENVRGLLSAKAHRGMEPVDATVGDGPSGPVLRAAGAVLGDLADIGYDAQWATVAASAVGAPHRRERVFILAHPADADPMRLQAHILAIGHEPELSRAGLPARAASHTPRDGWHEGRPEPTGFIGRSDAAQRGDGPVVLMPTPSAQDGNGGGRFNSDGHQSTLPGTVRDLLPTPEAKNAHAGPDYARMQREGSGGHDLVTAIAYHDVAESRWGKYASAIERWEALTRPAPSPTEPNKNGNPRLSAAFAEWLMGWPAGWCTDPAIGISRNDQLRCIGNGVVPQQAITALQWLLSIEAVAS